MYIQAYFNFNLDKKHTHTVLSDIFHVKLD